MARKYKLVRFFVNFTPLNNFSIDEHFDKPTAGLQALPCPFCLQTIIAIGN